MEEYPETVRGVLVHGGDKVRWLHSRVIAVPWWWQRGDPFPGGVCGVVAAVTEMLAAQE